MSKLNRDLSKVTAELTTYYKRRGLYGKRLRRAVRNDRLYVKHQGYGSTSYLISQFGWSRTPQGHHYWAARHST